MSEIYKLPGSSYDEISKIIQAYAANSGEEISLSLLSELSGIESTVISRNHSFLVNTNIITRGLKKSATDIGLALGKAYVQNDNIRIRALWGQIVSSDYHFKKILSNLEKKDAWDREEIINYLLSLANNTTTGARTGAIAVIEILKLTGIVEEKDGLFTVKQEKKRIENNKAAYELVKLPVHSKTTLPSVAKFSNEETTFYSQSYTCESGKIAKIIIPEDATEDDLLAIYDLLDIVLKRKFKLTR